MTAVQLLFQVLLLSLLLSASPLQAKRSGSHQHHDPNNNNNNNNNNGNNNNKNVPFKGPMNVTAVTGVDVDLRCRIKLQECGNFFSVVWYREEQKLPPPTVTKSASKAAAALGSDPTGMSAPTSVVSSQRVYVYRHNTGRGKSEGSWRGRVDHVYDAKRHVIRIRLRDTRLEDEAYYKCEVTYEERGRWFKESCLQPQLTRLNMLEAPTDIRLQVESGSSSGDNEDKNQGDDVQDGGHIGPFNEGALLSLKCTAEGGKPVPKITWWLGNQLLASSFYEQLSRGEDAGKGLVRSHATLVLSRAHLGTRAACKVSSAAMDTPTTVGARIDMNLAPAALEMHSPQLLSHEVGVSRLVSGDRGGGVVAEGGTMTVTCVARGAKPAAYIYWNSEPPLDLTNTVEEVTQHGLTYDTLNRLTFKAERRLTSLACFASNAVLDQERGMHLSQATTVNVRFRPEVKVDHSKVKGQGVNKIRINIMAEQLVLHCRYEANPMTGAKVYWYLNGRKILFGGDSNFERASADASMLKTKDKVGKWAQGNYSCQVENEIGRSRRTLIAQVIVEEKPRVSLSVEPTVSVAFKKNGAKGVSELLNANVTLSCIPADLKGGDSFLAVRWFLDGELLRAVSLAQKCIANITGNSQEETHTQDSEIEILDDCKTDPTKIVLLNVRRLFGGNYSCQGRISGADGVGWGAESAPTELKVLYPPRGARLRHRPDIVKKGAAFQLECSPDDSGFPPASMADWWHNGQRMSEVTSLTLRVAEATAAAAGNYSCLPRNEAGVHGEGREEQGATVNVEVHVAPRFFKRMPRYSGAPYNRRQFQLTCMVECDPVCSLSWLHNGSPVKLQQDQEEQPEQEEIDHRRRFRVRNSVWPPSPMENRLLSVESTLEMDLITTNTVDPWPRDEVSEAVDDNSGHNYTCVASGNSVGQGVRSTTTYRVHYPPRNISVGMRSLTVVEKSVPEPLACFADAFPQAKYYWQFEGLEEDEDMEEDGYNSRVDFDGDEEGRERLNRGPLLSAPNASISEGPLRHFRHPVSRRKAGTYTCTAYNDLGNQRASVTLKVLHPPSCRLRKEFRQSTEVKEDVVEVARKNGDNDEERDGEVLLLRCDVTEAEPRRNITFSWYHDGRLLRAGGAVLALPGSAEGSYSCEARNTVGSGPRCPIKVRPRPVAALVAETGYSTYLLFGGGAVTCVMVAAVAAAAFCRRMALGKYDYPHATTTEDNDDQNYDDNRDLPDCAPPNALTAPLPPSAVMANGTTPRHHQGILKSSNGNGHAASYGGNSRQQHLDNNSLTRNGVCRGAPAPPSYHNNHHYGTYGSNKRVTLNHHMMAEQEAMVPGSEDDVVDVDAVMNELMLEEDEMVYPPPPPPTGILRGGRTAGMRAGHPRELWLV